MTDPGNPPPDLPRPTSAADGLFNRERLLVVFFFAAYFFLIYQLFLVLAPFLAPLLGAAMLALVVFPLRQFVLRRIPSPSVASLLITILVMVTVIVPASVLTWILVREAAQMVPELNAWLTAQRSQGWPMTRNGELAAFDRLLAAAQRFFDMIELDVPSVASETVRELGNRITSAGATIVRKFVTVLFQLFILLLALFFFLRDGPSMIARLMDLVPMEAESKAMVLRGLDRTVVAMVRGTLITASAQGLLVGIGLAVAGIPYPVLLGFVATFLAVVPFIGTAIVWVPAVVYLVMTDQIGAAIGLTVWGVVAVGLIDNLLRPIVVGSHARLPATLLFLGVLGGFQVYGPVGGLISPLLIACVIAFARIYRERYRPPGA
ncbi:AI-2E family transporter [Dongia sedimenti]|uniref:AI-2E family transporter n=1 Tax=Dongia sedimenti TaxID=3064282 RepID=A0ABU0YT37_9PROT|nr:AI-2E family transporter [Rhodospirillaceae bacterium R-7]